MKASQVLGVIFVSVFLTIGLIKLKERAQQVVPSLAAADFAPTHVAKKKTVKNQHFSDAFDLPPDVFNAVAHVHAIADERRSDNYNTDISPGRSRVSASGVVVTSNGFIVTNYHVIKNAYSITITLHNKKLYRAAIVGVDPDNDLAVLKVSEHDLDFLPFGNSDLVRTGEWVIAVGFPWDLDQTTTAGIISALPRSSGNIPADYRLSSYFQTDAAINLGNSGGALLNTQGELIGINPAIVSANEAYTGYAYAIPSNTVRRVTHAIMDGWRDR